MRHAKVRRLGPTMKRGQSKQDYETDPAFIEAVVRRFGHIDFDLAATAANAQADRYFSPTDDSLSMDWSLVEGSHLWLNPEFGSCAVWSAKCAETARAWEAEGVTDKFITLLTPASVSTKWCITYVEPFAKIIPLFPRMTFVGEEDPFIKDLMLSLYGGGPGFGSWVWR